MRSYFNIKLLSGLAVAMFALLGLCMVTKSIAFAVMIPIAWAFIIQGKNMEVLFIVLFSCFVMLFNGFFVPKSAEFFICQKVLLVSASCFLLMQVFGRRNARILTPFLGLLPYLVYMFFVSQAGWAPVVSNLKLFLFTTVYLGMYGSAVRAMNDKSDLRKLRSMYLFIALYILIGSVVVWPVKSISVMGAADLALDPNVKSLYKGTTNHSQALGGLSAMLGTFLFCDWIFCIQKKSKLYLMLVILATLFVYGSQSRTAMAAYLFGIGFATLCAKRRSLIGGRWRRKMVSVVVTVGILGFFVLLLVPGFRNRALSFVVKYGDESEKVEVSRETVLSSRQYKLDSALANWRESPLTGNGFQVSEEMRYVKISSIRDMLSAPVEKSTWTHAILEEGGIIGLIVFCLFALITTVQLLRHQAYITATMFAQFLVSNLGEFTIFSMSGGGGIGWSVIFMATVFDHKRLLQERAMSQVGLNCQWGPLR